MKKDSNGFYSAPCCRVADLKIRNKLCAASFKGYSAFDDSVSGSEDMEEGSTDNWFNY